RLIFADGAVMPWVAVDATGTNVYEPADSCGPAGAQQVPRRVHNGFPEQSPGAPVTHARGAVVHDVDTGNSRTERASVGQISANDLHAELLQQARVAAGANDGADALALADESLGDMAADQAGGACDQVQRRAHEAPTF